MGYNKMTQNFEKAKEIIQTHSFYGNCGIFNSRSFIDNCMTPLYRANGLQIDICYNWAYFEVFGLKHDEWLALVEFYEELCEKNN